MAASGRLAPCQVTASTHSAKHNSRVQPIILSLKYVTGCTWWQCLARYASLHLAAPALISHLSGTCDGLATDRQEGEPLCSFPPWLILLVIQYDL
jgi:hypothetical protein